MKIADLFGQLTLTLLTITNAQKIMNIPAATKIDKRTQSRAHKTCRGTKLRMADLLRIGLGRVVEEFETTGGIVQSDPDIRISSIKKGRAGK